MIFYHISSYYFASKNKLSKSYNVENPYNRIPLETLEHLKVMYPGWNFFGAVKIRQNWNKLTCLSVRELLNKSWNTVKQYLKKKKEKFPVMA